MRSLLISACCGLLMMLQASDAQAQGRNFYGFKNIVHGHTKIGLAKKATYPPDDYYADIKGGYVDIFVSKGQCSDKYRFTWKFLDDISKLESGMVYRAELNGQRIEGNCRQNEAWAKLSGSNEKCQLCTDKNLTKSSISLAVKAKGDERSYAVPLTYNSDSEFEISVARVAEEETMIFLSFACTTNPSPSENFDYQVIYHYKKNYQPETGSIGFDCQMLYGIGTNLAFLETGAENGDDWEALKTYLSGALKYVRASNCLETDYLMDLKERMTDTEDGTEFYEEIKAYREKLPSLIPRDCIE